MARKIFSCFISLLLCLLVAMPAYAQYGNAGQDRSKLPVAHKKKKEKTMRKARQLDTKRMAEKGKAAAARAKEAGKTNAKGGPKGGPKGNPKGNPKGKGAAR